MPRRGKRDAQEDGDKDYKSMAPCYYVEKNRRGEGVCLAILHPKR